MRYTAIRRAKPQPLPRPTHEAEAALRESTEELKAAKDEAERANRVNDEFIAALSHELRTPLTPVLLAAQTLQDEISRERAFIGFEESLRESLMRSEGEANERVPGVLCPPGTHRHR